MKVSAGSTHDVLRNATEVKSRVRFKIPTVRGRQLNGASCEIRGTREVVLLLLKRVRT